MRELTIGKNDAGARLDRFVSKALPLLPPEQAVMASSIKAISMAAIFFIRSLLLWKYLLFPPPLYQIDRGNTTAKFPDRMRPGFPLQ